MKAFVETLIEVQQIVERKATELSFKLGWKAIHNDSDELYKAKLELRNASIELEESIHKYREAERKYIEAINADKGDI